MFHTVAFSETIQSVNTGSFVTPVVDNTVTINGDNLLVPDKFNWIFGAAAFAPASSTVGTSQLQAPSLRQVWYPNVTPVAYGATFTTYPSVYELWDNPIPLETNEGLNWYSDATLAAASGATGGIVFLSDGKRTSITGQKIYTMRCTSSASLVVNTWVNAALTFGQTLPVGNYDVVGMRAEGTGLLAARLNFIGPSAIVRPGTPGLAASTNLDIESFRYGRLGTWGSFYSLTPPSIDCMGASGSTQVIYLDLIPK